QRWRLRGHKAKGLGKDPYPGRALGTASARFHDRADFQAALDWNGRDLPGKVEHVTNKPPGQGKRNPPAPGSELARRNGQVHRGVLSFVSGPNPLPALLSAADRVPVNPFLTGSCRPQPPHPADPAHPAESCAEGGTPCGSCAEKTWANKLPVAWSGQC